MHSNIRQIGSRVYDAVIKTTLLSVDLYDRYDRQTNKRTEASGSVQIARLARRRTNREKDRQTNKQINIDRNRHMH